MKNKLCSITLKIKELFSRNKKYIPYLLLPPLAVFVIFSVFYIRHGIYPFGETSIAWMDLKQQGIPLLMNLRDVLCGDGSIVYSFNNASGMNFWGVFLFFLSNPFSLLCVFFKKSDIYQLVSLIMVLKLCTAAFTATLFFIKSNKKLSHGFASVLGLAYALCAYGLMYYQNLMWLDLMYIYPLLALGIERVTEGKGYGFYSAMLSLCVFYNFYLSYMIVLAVLIIIGLYLLISSHDKIYKKKRALDFFKGSAIAAMISSFSWIPAFIQYGNSGRGKNIIQNLKESTWGTSINTLFLIFFSTTIIFVGLYSLYKADRKRIAVFTACVLFMIPIFIEPINKMWHTGSYMAFTGRYAFISLFTCLELAALALEDREEDQKVFGKLSSRIPSYATPIIIVVGCVLIAVLAKFVALDMSVDNREALKKFTTTLYGNKKQLWVTIKVAIPFAITYIIFTAFYKFKAISKKVFTALLAGFVISESIFSINAYVITATKTDDLYKDYEEFLDLENRISDEDFYRIKTEFKYHDTNLLGALGYNSIGHYTSLTNLNYMNTAKALGYSSSWMELSTCGGTELSNAILGVRYNVIKGNVPNSVYTNGTYSIVKTFGSLGLGVKYSGENDIFTHLDSDRPDFQEKIFSSLFGTDEKLFERYTPTFVKNCIIDDTKYPIIIKGLDEIEYVIDAEEVINGYGEIEYVIDVKEEQTLYFDAFGEYTNNLRQAINNGFKVFVNDKQVSTHADGKEVNHPDGLNTGFLNLGTYCNETVKIRLITRIPEMSLLSYGVYGLKRDVLKKELVDAESGFLNAEGNKVWGKVNGKKGEHLFIAVPYDDGFTITLNGKEIKGEKVFGDFYSIPLVDGENNIEMKYTPKGLVVGISGCIFGLLLAIYLRYRTIKKRKAHSTENEGDSNLPKKSKKREKASYGAFIVLFSIVILVIYIAPVFINLFG